MGHSAENVRFQLENVKKKFFGIFIGVWFSG